MSLRLFVGTWFQLLFHSPNRVSFHLSLTVLVHYRSPRVFSLGVWSHQIPTRFLDFPVVLKNAAGVLPLSPTGLSPSLIARSRGLRLEVGFVTPWRAWRPSRHALQPSRDIGLQPTQSLKFRLLPFRSPLLRECSLFLGVLRCFNSPAYLSQAYEFGLEFSGFTGEGFPIRVPPAKPARRLTGAFRSLAAPFFGSWRLGILRGPLVA